MRESNSKILLTVGTLLAAIFLPGLSQFALAENLELHEAVNVQGSGHSNSCVAPATYSYDDTFGVVDCRPLERGTCDFVTVCYYRRTKGCFPPEAKIQMFDGSQKAIVNLQSGDQVWNPVLKKSATVGRLTSGSEATPLLEFGYGDVRIRVTEKHPMMVLGNEGKSTVYASAEGGVAQHEAVHAYCAQNFGTTGPMPVAPTISRS